MNAYQKTTPKHGIFKHGLSLFSKRRLSEQLLGLFCLSIISFVTLIIAGLISQSTFGLTKFDQLPHRLIYDFKPVLWGYYLSFSSISLWLLWRRYSLKQIRLEMILYVTQLPLILFWITIISLTEEYLLGLINILFLISLSIIAFPLLWKKHKLTALLLIPNLFWLLYLMIMNLQACLVLS